MARITVEDCLDHVDNRFNLVLLATKRARQLVRGGEPLVPLENDKPTVVALREIAEGLVTKDTMEALERRKEVLDATVEVTAEAMEEAENSPPPVSE